VPAGLPPIENLTGKTKRKPTMKRTILTAAFLSFTVLSASAQGAPGSHFLENWDLNLDGKVSLEDAKERRADIFVMFDMDENGELSAEEYKLFDKTREEDAAQNAGGHANGGMRRTQEGLTLAFNDVDGNGSVSKEEFVGKSADWLALIDKNGDGEVTAADFGPGK